MEQNETLKNSIRQNLDWFEHSGVMLPADGLWGVGERILLTQNNETMQKTMDSFPAWTIHDGYAVIEARRADCNMETAFLYLLASQALQDDALRKTAENILDFLYFRSGLLLRNEYNDFQTGVWKWSHIQWKPGIWWDDDSWMAILQFKIAQNWPELDKRFDMKAWGMKLATQMADEFLTLFTEDYDSNKPVPWSGNLNLPHWGSLVVAAMAQAYKADPQDRFTAVMDRYHDFLLKDDLDLNASEYSYAIMGAMESWCARQDDRSLTVARKYAELLLAKMNMETGNIPAEHYEAPKGGNLADTIYTLNWAIIALQELAQHPNWNPRYVQAYDTLRKLLITIQDQSPEPQFKGCWRGMYDLDAKTWGGGNCYEGGAGSIYTGWTNAPIAWTMANAAMGKALTDY